MDKYSIVLNRISISSHVTIKDFFTELIKREYDKESVWGFSNVNLIDSLVSAILLKKVTAYYRVWNDKTEEMEQQSYNMIKEIKFCVDFKKSYFMVEGGVSNMNIVKQSFRNMFWNSFIYSSIDKTPYDYLLLFQKDKLLVDIDELTINDFRFKEIFLGRYIARLTMPILDIEFLSNYKSSISKSKMILKYMDENIIFTVSKTNNLTIACSENVKFSFLEYLMSKLY